MNTARFWRILLPLVGIELVVVVYFLKANADLRRQARQAAQASEALRAPSPTAGRVARLQKENERLKSDLGEIPQLTSKKATLETEAAGQHAANADWVNVQSNRIQQAIDRSKQELKEIHDWMRNQHEIERREKAQARLREKGLPADQSPEATAKDYDQLRARLSQIGLAMKKQVELREEWVKSDKSEQTRAKFQPQFAESHRAWQAALGQLGDDRVLYDEIPVRTPLQNSPSATPVLRSVVPDLRGNSVTVYLDGSVVFSR